MRIFHCTVALLLAVSGIATGQAQAPAPAAPYSSEFQVFFRGVPIGNEQLSVTRDQEGVRIAGSSRIGAPVNLTARRVEIRYSPSGAPLSCSIEGSVQDRLLVINTSVANGMATSDVTQAAVNSRKSDAVAADAVLLLNSYFGSYEGLANRLAAMKQGDELQAYIVPQGQLAVRVRGVASERLRTPAGPVEARRVGVRMVDPSTPVDAEIWITTDGHLLRLSVPSQGFEMVRSDIASVSTRREPVSRPNDEQVRIQANGFSIAATLSQPTGAPVGRRPAVVLVPGAGRTDRDEALSGIPLYGQLAATLADAGFVVVRYDKRGVGQSGGREETAGIADYAEDVRAVVQFLRKRKDVDGKRVALLGHAEGGMIAMAAAARDDGIRGLVLVATPGVTGAEHVLEQQRQALSRMNLPEAERQAKIALQAKINQAVLSGTGWEEIPPQVRRQADTAWFRSFLAFDPAVTAKKVDQAVLILQGERDREVLPANADKLLTAMKGRKPSASRTADVVRVPGVNHLLVESETGEVDEYAAVADKMVSQAVAKPIADWLKGTLADRR
jgi:pimeloyl-ACP methyl ester carboxylesterase